MLVAGALVGYGGARRSLSFSKTWMSGSKEKDGKGVGGPFLGKQPDVRSSQTRVLFRELNSWAHPNWSPSGFREGALLGCGVQNVFLLNLPLEIVFRGVIAALRQ